MALGDVRFTPKQRQQLHRFVVIGISIGAVVGSVLLLLGVCVPASIGATLRAVDRTFSDWVFAILSVYGLNVLCHNLVGAKLCHNYVRCAEGSHMSLRLFVWALFGLAVSLVGCVLASLCASTAESLVSQLRRSLFHGMKQYLTDPTWKRALDQMQIQMECCGVDAYTDWHETYWMRHDALDEDSPVILEYAELDGRILPPVVPWSCCRIDVKGPCYHDPLQLPNPERDLAYESLHARGCLVALKGRIVGALLSSAALIALLFVVQVAVIVTSRLDFTAARNAVALGNRYGPSPGWLYGRLDFGNAAGPNLCQIDRKNSGRGDVMVDLKPLVYASDTE